MTQHPRQRSDSVSAEVAAYQAVTRPIDPPEPLPKALLPIWKEVTEMRAAAEWSALDLRLAHSLVIALGDLRSQEKMLSREAKVNVTPHGLVANPRLAVVERLSSRILKLQMRLLLSPRANGYRADRTEHQRRIEREARARVDPIGAFLDAGGEPMELLLGPMNWPIDDPRSQILPTSGDGPVNSTNGKPRAQ